MFQHTLVHKEVLISDQDDEDLPHFYAVNEFDGMGITPISY